MLLWIMLVSGNNELFGDCFVCFDCKKVHRPTILRTYYICISLHPLTLYPLPALWSQGAILVFNFTSKVSWVLAYWSERSACAARAALQTGCMANEVATEFIVFFSSGQNCLKWRELLSKNP